MHYSLQLTRSKQSNFKIIVLMLILVMEQVIMLTVVFVVRDLALERLDQTIAHMLNKLQMHRIWKTQFLNSTMLFYHRVQRETNTRIFVKVVVWLTKLIIVVTLQQRSLVKRTNAQNRTSVVQILTRLKLVFFSTFLSNVHADELYYLIKITFKN